MHYSIAGNGPPVVLIHGIATDGRLWADVVPVLCSGVTCVVVELIGPEGVSATGNYTLDLRQLARELHELRDRLGYREWSVVGHDIGSTIAVLHAGAQPSAVRSLCICTAPVVPDFRPPIILRQLRWRGLGDCLGPLVVPLVWRFIIPRAVRRRDAASRNAITRFRAPYRGVGGSRRFIDLLRWGNPRVIMQDTARILGALECPVRVIHGRDDPAIPLRLAAKASETARQAELIVLEAGHFLPVEEPQLLAKHLATFLHDAERPPDKHDRDCE